MEKNKKNKIIEIIDQGTKLVNGVKEGIIKNSECEDFFHNTIRSIYNIFNKDDIHYRIFNKRQLEKYGNTIRRSTREGYSYAKSSKKIEELLEILQKIIGYKTIANEKHFKSGDTYEVTRYFNKLFDLAKSEILILDEYIDSNIFDFIEEIDISISIKILTSDGYKSNFKKLYKSYNGGNLKAKLHKNNNHDRYIILDRSSIYFLGTSINGIGKKDFTITKLEGKGKIDDIYSSWKDGNNLE